MNLAARDRRRARAVWRAFCQDNLFNPPWVINFEPSAVLFIAAALKREREEAGFAAVNYFFARKADREKARAAILGEQKKGKR